MILSLFLNEEIEISETRYHLKTWLEYIQIVQQFFSWVFNLFFKTQRNYGSKKRFKFKYKVE